MNIKSIKRMILLGGMIFLLAGLVRITTGGSDGIPLLAIAGLCLAGRFILAIKDYQKGKPGKPAGKPGRTSSPISSEKEKMVKGINFRLRKCEKGEKMKKEAKKEKKTGKKTVEWILHKQHCRLCKNGDKKIT